MTAKNLDSFGIDGVHPESETARVSPARQIGAGNGKPSGSEEQGDRVLASGSRTAQPGRECPYRGQGTGSRPERVGAVARPAELRGATSGEAADAGSSASQGSGEAEAGLGGEGAGGGFFARCLAQNRCPTPEERNHLPARLYAHTPELSPAH